MSRYIDADKLPIYILDLTYYDGSRVRVVTAEDIDDAPSIDIVRCGECKYELICNHSVQHTTHDAQSITIGGKSVGYCSYGERVK